MTLKEIFDKASDGSTEKQKAKITALSNRYGFEETKIQKCLATGRLQHLTTYRKRVSHLYRAWLGRS